VPVGVGFALGVAAATEGAAPGAEGCCVPHPSMNASAVAKIAKIRAQVIERLLN
jgi:hypothetical protein